VVVAEVAFGLRDEQKKKEEEESVLSRNIYEFLEQFDPNYNWGFLPTVLPIVPPIVPPYCPLALGNFSHCAHQ